MLVVETIAKIRRAYFSQKKTIKEINEAGSKTSGGRAWTVVELRDVLTRPRNMGYVSHGAVGRKGFEIPEKV